MFDGRTIREGMVVRTAEGRRLGRVARLEDHGFVIEKGLARAKEVSARYADIERVEHGEIVLGSMAAAEPPAREEDAGPVMAKARRIGHAPPDVIERRAEALGAEGRQSAAERRAEDAASPQVARETRRVEPRGGAGSLQREHAVGIGDDGRARTWTSEGMVAQGVREERPAQRAEEPEEGDPTASDERLREPVRGDPS